MDGKAIKWFTNHNAESPFINWGDFCFQLSERYDSQLDDDHHAKFAQVIHTTSLDPYIKDFEDLVNHAHDFTNKFWLQTFISSL